MIINIHDLIIDRMDTFNESFFVVPHGDKNYYLTITDKVSEFWN